MNTETQSPHPVGSSAWLGQLLMGDVLEWTWDENGVAVAGGQGIVLEDTKLLVQKGGYEIRALGVAELAARVSRIRVVANIFHDRDFKLQVDKHPVLKDGEIVIINGEVQLA